LFKLGLKLWSDNEKYISEAKKLYEKKMYDYIELYIVPGTYDRYIKTWQKLGIPFIIHCTHFLHGFNLAEKNKYQENIKMFFEVRAFCDQLNGKYIIFHPGVEGRIEESIRQINLLHDERLLVENKPYVSMLNDYCRGSSYEEINKILNFCDVGFCLDIAHAFNKSYHIKQNEFKYVKKMISLSPKVIHICDGKLSAIHDKHLHIGEGEYDFVKIRRIISISKAEFLTVETCKTSDKLTDFVEDVKKIKSIMNKG